MKKALPFIVILASIGLIFVNILDSEAFDKQFWLRTVSSVLLIVAMIFTIRSQNASED
ncbi:hypothetical protein [Lacinutrix sp. MedPE-SW]|uniref:hypothetical protein n=1 Tax=Lacinutrix sp. MedPE-SW TaxID=1860087 RepID=UPI000A8C4C85|nr:hypothetical protein [Lacinutrix sp. MedPE-SW]